MTFSVRLLTLICFIVFLVSCRTSSKEYILTSKDVKDRQHYRWVEDSSVLVFSSKMLATFAPLTLKPGKYIVSFSAAGEAAPGVLLPTYSVFLGNLYMGDSQISP